LKAKRAQNLFDSTAVAVLIGGPGRISLATTNRVLVSRRRASGYFGPAVIEISFVPVVFQSPSRYFSPQSGATLTAGRRIRGLSSS